MAGKLKQWLEPSRLTMLRTAVRNIAHTIRLKLFGPKPNVVVYPNVSRISLAWLKSRGLLDALVCMLSEQGSPRIMVVLAPCEGRIWPRRYRSLESIVSRCADFEACTDPLTGKLYPDHPSPERCMRIENENGCLIVYVKDLEGGGRGR